MKKLAVLSHVLPPISAGHAIVLYKLLKSWSPDEYCLITDSDFIDVRKRGKFEHSKEWLPAPYFRLPSDIKLKAPRGRLLSISVSLVNLFSSVLRRGWRSARIVRKGQCKSLLACSGNIANIPAGFIASKLARVDFIIYLFDDYTYQWTSRFYRWFASQVERRILNRADAVIVPNEYLAASYKERYGIKPIVIHNPTSFPSFELKKERSCDSEKLDVIYTGSIYHAHYDAFINLIKAVASVKLPKTTIHIYTEQPADKLAKIGIEGPLVFHKVVNNEDVRHIQNAADILFLPLAFDSEIPEIIRTSAPGKMGEYLASGTPVLVHAPADSYVSWYFRQYHCGLVVDRKDPGLLAEALLRLAQDMELRKAVTKNAWQRAREDFSIEQEGHKFRDIFNE